MEYLIFAFCIGLMMLGAWLVVELNNETRSRF